MLGRRAAVEVVAIYFCGVLTGHDPTHDWVRKFSGSHGSGGAGLDRIESCRAGSGCINGL